MSAAGRNQGRRRLAGQPGVASVTRLLPLPPQAFLTALPAEIGGLGSAGLASPHRRRASHSAFCTRAAAAAGGVLWVRRAWSKVKSGSGDEQRQAYLLAHSPRYRPFPPPRYRRRLAATANAAHPECPRAALYIIAALPNVKDAAIFQLVRGTYISTVKRLAPAGEPGVCRRRRA